jgi:hypothetical protein
VVFHIGKGKTVLRVTVSFGHHGEDGAELLEKATELVLDVG